MSIETYAIAAPFIWIAGWIAISVLYRLKAGKPVFPRAPKTAVFSEAWASGRSLANILTRMGGARNCLLVYVADGMLTVIPVFPFNLMFLPEIFGLEVTAPTTMLGVEQVDGLFGKRLRISVEGSTREKIELSVRDPNGLQGAISAKNSARVAISAASVGDRKRSRRFTFGCVFLIFWGSVVLVMMTGELKADFQFRKNGIAATAKMVDHTGQTGSKGDNGILQYSVQGHTYRIVSIQGSGIYRIGDTAQVRYLPNDPASAREDGQLTFDLLFVCAGVFTLAIGLTLGRIAPVSYDTKGDTGRIILETLRTATKPLTTEQVCQAVMVARRLDTNDKALCRTMMRRTNANLKHWAKKRGLIRSMPGPGQQLLWEIAS